MANYDYQHASSTFEIIDPDNFVTGDENISTNTGVYAINAAIIPKYTLLSYVANQLVPATLSEIENIYGLAAYDIPINTVSHKDEVITGGKFNQNDIVLDVSFVGGIDSVRQKLREIGIFLRAPGIST